VEGCAVEATSGRDAGWFKSSYSGGANNNCVEVRFESDVVLVRDSKRRDGGVLRFGADEWRAFVQGAQAGEFDATGR
jgi:hypothetical protein